MEIMKGVDSVILNLPEENDWILIPNYIDKSLMRIYLALDLARSIGMPYVPRTRYVELYLNNKYEGNYLLIEKIKRDKNRFGISKLTEEERDQIEHRLTGGYILRIDLPKGREHFTSKITGLAFIYHYPKGGNITEAQKNCISSFINELESVLYIRDFKDPVDGYRKYIDVDSFVDWYKVNELAFDSNLRKRNHDLSIEAGPFGDLFMDQGLYDMEVKVNNCIPLWISQMLSCHHCWRQQYSKYTNSYKWDVLSEPGIRAEGTEQLCGF